MSARLAYVRRARHWIANRGWRGLFTEMFYRLRLLLAGQPLPGRQTSESAPHPFDLAYGVDTAGLVWGESLDGVQEHEEMRYWATGYYGIAPSTFTAALEHLALDWSRFTFVDIGCGKGRALLLALRFPFQRVLGIELSPALAAEAQRNLEHFNAPWREAAIPTEVVAADATTFALPRGPVLLFLYHPFAAPVMKRFIAHVQSAARAEAREIILLYANPELDAHLVATPGLTRLWREQFLLSEEDTRADRFNSRYEYFAAYRIQG